MRACVCGLCVCIIHILLLSFIYYFEEVAEPLQQCVTCCRFVGIYLPVTSHSASCYCWALLYITFTYCFAVCKLRFLSFFVRTLFFLLIFNINRINLLELQKSYGKWGGYIFFSAIKVKHIHCILLLFWFRFISGQKCAIDWPFLLSFPKEQFETTEEETKNKHMPIDSSIDFIRSILKWIFFLTLYQTTFYTWTHASSSSSNLTQYDISWTKNQLKMHQNIKYNVCMTDG